VRHEARTARVEGQDAADSLGGHLLQVPGDPFLADQGHQPPPVDARLGGVRGPREALRQVVLGDGRGERRERIGDIGLRDGERDLDEVERVHRLGHCVRLT
jgi:hypothetical protein